MDIIILGILMMKKATIYEMRKLIDSHFTNISSNSLGSIQAAIKKLIAKDYIVFEEFVENSINKKKYAITESGRDYFLASVKTPMLYKEKNMELSKFFFMGFVGEKEWLGLIDVYIAELKSQLSKLKEIAESSEPRTAFDIQELQNIALFQYGTLDLSIAKIEFEINWFEKFTKKIIDEQEGR
ncbi:PadR family transcriptional regulator AphA [Enterococcus sp. PF1-24]|uniref:PadR family transcriptional regulator n=1 Tax=unclassified Enterococcus TaxID=2608891 RepID=UPI0024737995|nr:MULTISPECIES: PadR family transcriptional regulator [unclassified Enterococcus]MDH6364405.1 PadR family transcriptional regulator AphA [Enterococcus sp. PFB1-1]MDH6401572.1 PadR family transcriptional regulator AphA [Enterococcus sp. PF1-24]